MNQEKEDVIERLRDMEKKLEAERYSIVPDLYNFESSVHFYNGVKFLVNLLTLTV